MIVQYITDYSVDPIAQKNLAMFCCFGAFLTFLSTIYSISSCALMCSVSLSIKVDIEFEITGSILGQGEQGSVRNSGEFEITEFEIADSK